MKIAGICFLILGGVLLLMSGLYLVAYLIFEKSPHKTGRTLGKLYSSKYKKDVNVWTGFGKYDGPPRIAFTIKHLTKTKYALINVSIAPSMTASTFPVSASVRWSFTIV